MARRTKKTEEVSVFDLFDDIATEPLEREEQVGSLIVSQTVQRSTESDSATVSFDGSVFAGSSRTVSS